MMRDQLQQDKLWEDGSDSRVIMAIEEGHVVAWALAYTDESEGGRIVYFYVHKDHRRKGHARKLYRHARRLEGEILVCPCNQINRSFFRSVGATAAPGWS